MRIAPAGDELRRAEAYSGALLARLRDELQDNGAPTATNDYGVRSAEMVIEAFAKRAQNTIQRLRCSNSAACNPHRDRVLTMYGAHGRNLLIPRWGKARAALLHTSVIECMYKRRCDQTARALRTPLRAGKKRALRASSLPAKGQGNIH